jgi:hypothetical protein
MPETDRCPRAPEGQSHRWRLTTHTRETVGRCRYCGTTKTYPSRVEGAGTHTWRPLSLPQTPTKDAHD